MDCVKMVLGRATIFDEITEMIARLLLLLYKNNKRGQNQILLSISVEYKEIFMDRNIIYTLILPMGNYCCSTEDQLQPQARTTKLKRKVSLLDPCIKKKYQESLGVVINNALQKFNEGKTIREVLIKMKLGKGSQASVFLVEVTTEDKFGELFKKDYAMKRVSKKNLDIERTKKALLLENQILAFNNSNFLAQIEYAFQDSSYLYYLMKVAIGGDIYQYIKSPRDSIVSKSKMMDEKGEICFQFILAGVVLGLEYLHKNQIIYRDLKPENILMYEDGYPKLADFGIAKKSSNSNLCYDIKGSVLYFSPEMILRKGYDKANDLWALGVLTYEFLLKQPPFSSSIINSGYFQNACINWERNPHLSAEKSISQAAFDLIKKLLKLNPQERLGYQNIEEIKKHEFFNGIDWQAYACKQVSSPIQQIVSLYPMVFDPYDSQLDQLLETEQHGNIPFTFVREQRTRTNTAEKIRHQQSSSSDESGDSF